MCTHYTLLIYLSGSPGKTKAKSKNDVGPQDSPDPLVGGETVFYGPRNALVAEVHSHSLVTVLFLSHVY